jgi:hypothetical protein
MIQQLNGSDHEQHSNDINNDLSPTQSQLHHLTTELIMRMDHPNGPVNVCSQWVQQAASWLMHTTKNSTIGAFNRIWMRTYGVTTTAQDDVAALESIDCVDGLHSVVIGRHQNEEGDEVVLERPLPTRNHRSGTYELVMEIKYANPGIEVDNVANRLVAQRLLVLSMKERNWRTADIAHQLPYALELVFIPSFSDISARRMTATQAIMARKAAYTELVYHRERPTLWNWFGRMIRPEPIPQL